MAKLLYQGHGSFRITAESGYVIYVDPFAGKGYDRPADLILVSHEHSDHNNVGLVPRKDGCRVLRSSDLLKGGVYGTFREDEVSVESTPACNRNHPLGECVGFLITVDGVKLYAAGDTSKTDYMSRRLSGEHVDYALLPIDGVYNMDAAEASECAKIIGAEHTIPIHMKPGALFDERMACKLHAAGRLILQPGAEIHL